MDAIDPSQPGYTALKPKICRKCFGDGFVEIQSGPYTRTCDSCNGTGYAPDSPVQPDPMPPTVSAPTVLPSTQEEDVLLEALRITSGDRQAQYGPPDQDFSRTAGMWSSLFSHKLKEPFEPRDVAMAMICLKLSRETHQRKRDNAVDGAGYFRCLHLCNQARNATARPEA